MTTDSSGSTSYLNGVTQDLLESPPTKEPSKRKLGYALTKIVLAITVVYLVAFLIFLFIHQQNLDGAQFVEKNYSALSNASNASQVQNIITDLSREGKAYRDFLFGMTQMILLNFLLPVLTALLGYMFGSEEDKD